MAKKLGFTYTLSVDETKSASNLRASIKNIKDKNPNLSIPVNLKLNTTIPSETLKNAKEVLKKKTLNLPVDFKLNPKSITNTTISEAQKILNEKSNKLSLSIGLKIDTKAIAKLENVNATFKEMKTLTNDVVKNVQKLAGVKLQIYENVDNKGKVKNSKKSTVGTTNIDLSTEVQTQQRLIQLQIDSLKRKKEYQYVNQSIIEDLETQNSLLGTGAESIADVKEEARQLKLYLKEVTNEASKGLYSDSNLTKGLTDQAKTQAEQEKIKTKQMQQQKEIAMQISKLVTGKNGGFLSEQDITRLKNAEASFNNLKATSMTELNNSLKNTKQVINEISNDANNKRLNATSENIETLGKKLQNLGLYVSGAMVIQELWGAIHQGVGYIKELDEAYTDVAISMDITKSEFKEWTKNAREIAQANGQMTTSAMDMVKIYATAGESISEIEDKLAGTLAIQNITQWTAEQTTSAVSSVLGQYKLLEQEINGVTGDVANAIEYMGDALVGISNELTIDNVAGIQEMINAIDTAGGIMYQSGASMEWYMAVTGALKETMNATGDEVANAFKMISARVFAQAQAMEELGESAETIEIEMRKAEVALTSVGVAVRDASDPSKLRGLEEIMDELAGKWNTLSDATKNFVAEGVAGTNRRNYFITMMENYERVTDLTNAGLESQGELAKANEVRVNSLAGQISILTDKCLALMDGLEPLIYGTVKFGNAILDLVNGLGVIPSAIGIATASFLTFNQTGRAVRDSLLQISQTYVPLVSSVSKHNAVLGEEKLRIEQLIQKAQLKIASTKADILAKQRLNESTDSLNKKLTMQQTVLQGAQRELAKTTLKTVALQTVMSMGLSLGITLLISGFNLLINKLKDSSGQMDKTKESAKNLSDTLSEIDSVSVDIERFKELNELLENESLESEKRLEYEQELASLRTTLGSNEDFKTLLQDETMEYEKQYNYMKGIVDLRSRESIKESLKDLEDNEDTLNKKSASFTSYVQQLETSISRMEQKEADLRQAQEDFANASDNATRESLQAKIDQIKADMVGIQTTIDEALSNALDIKEYADNHNYVIDAAKKASVYTDITSINLENSSKTFLENFIAAKIESEEIANNMENASDDPGISFERTAEEIRKTREEYLDLCDELETAKELLKDINKNGMNLDNARELFDTFTDFTGNIHSAADAQDFLNNKIAEMQEKHNEAYLNMMRDDENFWNNKMKNSEEWQNFVNKTNEEIRNFGLEILGEENQDYVDFINKRLEQRQIDLGNAKTMAEAERILSYGLVSDLSSYFSQLVDDKGTYRGIDYSNIIKFLNSQGAKEAETVQQLRDLWRQYYQDKLAALTSELNSLDSSAYEGDRENIYSDFYKLRQENLKLEKLFTSMDNSFKGVSGSLSQNSAGTGALTKPSSSSSGSSSSSKNNVEDLELEIDRYYKLNDALNDVNKALEKNRTLQEQTSDINERKKLMNEEIELLEKQKSLLEDLKKEQQKELGEHKSLLSSYGFNFDKDGNITNYASKLKELQDQANKLSGDAKKNAIENVKYIASIIEAYTTLSNETLPDTINQILEMNKTIQDTKEEHEELLKKVERLGNRYFELEQSIKKVENALALNQAKQQNASATERVKLIEEEIKLLKERQKLIAQQQKEVQDEATELKDKLSQKGVTFDKDGSINNYTKLIENLTKKANSLVGDAREKVLDEIQEIIDMMEQYEEIVNETLPDLAEEWEEYANSIYEAEKEKAQTIADIQKDVSSAIENEYNKRYEALKKSLQKEKDLYNAQYEKEDFENNLAKENRKLDEIKQQMNDLSRDTSLAGQLRLQQLKEEYDAQLEVINQMIRDNEKQLGNDRFDEEMEKIDEEKEETLSAENLADMVNKALADGFVTIGGEVIELNTLMTDWLNETGDGLTAVGSYLKSELIDNLRVAQGLLQNMGAISVNGIYTPGGSPRSVGNTDSIANMSRSLSNVGQLKSTEVNSNVTIGNILTVEGNVTEDSLDNLQVMLDEAKNSLLEDIAKELGYR